MASILDLHCSVGLFFDFTFLHGLSLHFLYCRRVGSASSAHLPSPRAFSFTNLILRFVPPSHCFEHFVHFVHALRVQSLSQACTLHAFAWLVSPHDLPPNFMWTFTSRARCDTPPPHCAVQVLHLLHCPTLQSTGHGLSLQVRF